MAIDAAYLLDIKDALGGNLAPLRHRTPAKAEGLSELGVEPPNTADVVDCVHAPTLSATKRLAQAKSLSDAKFYLRDNAIMDVGDLIAKRRKALGHSQNALAKLVGVDKSAVAQWELNSTRPTGEHMDAVKRILGIEIGLQPPSSAPYRGKLVEDPDLLAWLDFLEPIPSAERQILAKHIMGGLAFPKKG